MGTKGNCLSNPSIGWLKCIWHSNPNAYPIQTEKGMKKLSLFKFFFKEKKKKHFPSCKLPFCPWEFVPFNSWFYNLHTAPNSKVPNTKFKEALLWYLEKEVKKKGLKNKFANCFGSGLYEDNWKLGYAIKLIVTVAIIAKGENERHKDISQFASSKVYAFG